MVTHASPVYDGNAFVGVLAIDITLNFLDRFTKTLAGPAGRIILTTNEGKVLVDTGMDAEATFSEVKELDDLLSNKLRGAVKKLLKSDSFVTSSAGEYYLLADRLQSAPWTVIHILDKGDLADYLSPTRITYGVIVIVMISLALLTNYAVRRRKAEASLLKSERRYQEMVDYAAIGVYQVSRAGEFMMVNPELIRMFGYSGRDDINSSMPNINNLYVDPQERPALLRELDDVGFISGAEVRFRHKSGRIIWTRISTRSIKNRQGDTLYYEGFMADVTARREAEAALVESSKKYRQFIEHAPVGFFTVDASGQFTYANPVLLAMTGYNWDEWSNRPVTEAVHKKDLPLVLEKVQESRDGKKTQPPFEIRILTASGETMWVQVTSEAIFAQDDDRREKLAQLQCFVLDITERRRAEEERGRLQAQLLQSQKMEAIGTLAGGIAHDFNNILSAVLGYAELAQTEMDNAGSREENLQQIINAGNRAKGLVQQILQFSRQTSGEKIPVQVSPLIKEALKLLRASLPTTIDIQSDLGCDAAIMVDPTQLHQVVMNLCTNSAHSMEQSGGTLTLGLTEEFIDANWDPELLGLKIGRYMKLTVADTGQGIDHGLQKRIFDPFFTTKELGHGTGMGLAVVHGIVQDAGGTVKVKSEPGKGAVFDVYLPITGTEASPVSAADSPLATGSETILLVDDEEFQTDLGKRMLERLGYKVYSRNSSTDALALFQTDPGRFDLVITDLTMPNMTGDQLATEMLKVRSDIPIIMCTGFSERVTEQQARALGVREFAMKPLVFRELAKIVRKVLDEDE